MPQKLRSVEHSSCAMPFATEMNVSAVFVVPYSCGTTCITSSAVMQHLNGKTSM